MSFIHVFGNLAFILVATSFMVKDILWLRVLSITASTCSIFYNYNVASKPLWVPIGWNLFFMSLNFYHIYKIIKGMEKIHLNDKEKELYQISFSDLTIIEFSKLIRLAEWRKAEPGEILIKEGVKVQDLLLIYNGEVEIVAKDKIVNHLKDGQYVGEMSFMSNLPATATVKVVHPLEYLAWDQEKLRDLIKRNPSLVFSLHGTMASQINNLVLKNNHI